MQSDLPQLRSRSQSPCRCEEIFNEATSLRRAGQQMIHWKHLWQTPSVYVRQLRPTGGTAWWDPKELPLAQVRWGGMEWSELFFFSGVS